MYSIEVEGIKNFRYARFFKPYGRYTQKLGSNEDEGLQTFKLSVSFRLESITRCGRLSYPLCESERKCKTLPRLAFKFQCAPKNLLWILRV